MKQHKLMTYDEKAETLMKAIELRKTGDKEGHDRLMKTVPMPYYMARVLKEKIGLDFLLSLDWNLSEVEAEFGSEYLSN